MRGIKEIPMNVAIIPIPIGTNVVNPLEIAVVIGATNSAVIAKPSILLPPYINFLIALYKTTRTNTGTVTPIIKSRSTFV